MRLTTVWRFGSPQDGNSSDSARRKPTIGEVTALIAALATAITAITGLISSCGS